MDTQRIINVHTHVHRTQDVDERVKLWRQCGLVKVCVQSLSIGGNERTCGNDEVLGWARKYPDLILAFAHAKLGWEVDVPATIDRFKEQGFTGLKFIAPSYAYDDDSYFPLYVRAEQLDMPILFHTGFLSISPGQRERGISQEKMRALRLDTIGRAFPRLRIMAAHLGNPQFQVGLDITYEFPNIWGEYSGASGSRFRETSLRRLLAPLPGADMADPQENLALTYFRKLCFATDNPDPPKWIALNRRLMDWLELPDDLREDFWWRNAARWLGTEQELT